LRGLCISLFWSQEESNIHFIIFSGYHLSFYYIIFLLMVSYGHRFISLLFSFFITFQFNIPGDPKRIIKAGNLLLIIWGVLLGFYYVRALLIQDSHKHPLVFISSVGNGLSFIYFIYHFFFLLFPYYYIFSHLFSYLFAYFHLLFF